MTNKEALLAVLRISVPDNSLEKALTDREVTGGSTYTKDNAKNIDLCAIDIFQGLLTEPDVSEGDYSIKFDRDAVKEHLLLLAKKHDVTEILNEFKPSVTAGLLW